MMARLKTALVFFFMATAASAACAAGQEHGVSPHAYEIGRVFGIPVTNAMITGWIISIVIIIAMRLAVGAHGKLIPSRGQAVVESLATSIRDMIEPIVGKKMVNPTFPALVGFFTFILLQNLSGLLPGVGTVGHEVDGHFVYYLRPASSDMNTTLALALIAMACWLYFVLRYAGLKVLIYDLFGNKAAKKEIPRAMYFVLHFVFFAVGIIEIISICFRPVSLSLRLYGNVFGGENLLTSMTGIFPWVLPVPFYLLEGLVAIVQALVFTLLVAVYIGLVCNHDEEGH